MGSKFFKTVVALSVAIMFTLIAFNNIIDYCTNFRLLRTVLSMETVVAENIKWRAITSPQLQHMAYVSIISWEALTALICWSGALLMMSKQNYNKGRRVATAGLTMGFSLFMVAFVVVAGEWFYLWDSSLGPMHSKAILFSLLLATSANFVSRSD